MQLKQIFSKYEISYKVYQSIRVILTSISPTLATKVIFRISKGRPLDLKNPRTLDEKISWLKLNTYYKNPLVSKCADKYAVREYIKTCGCPEILNELYGVYNSVEGIPWADLPDRFVLKWNMGCGCNIICADKNSLDIENARQLLSYWGKKKYYLSHAEMQYKYIPPRIICEKYLEVLEGELPDYKFYCFNGEAKYVMVCLGRGQGHPQFYYYDREWNLLKLSEDAINAPADFNLPKPDVIEEMFEYASKLSKPFPFVRADFYLVDGKIIFGELTFTPSGGIDSGRLPETDIALGRLVKLPIEC